MHAVKMSAVVAALAACGIAEATMTWDGARFIRNGLAEWYDDIPGNNVSNIYFKKNGDFMYTGNTAVPETHWLAEDFSAPGMYEYTFLASNNLGNTGITTYNMELNFNGGPRLFIQASTTSPYMGGASYVENDIMVTVSEYSFTIVPLANGGVDEVANFNSTADGAADIQGYLKFTVSRVPAPGVASALGLATLMGVRRRR